jgi:hypothetical protein
LNGGCFCVRFGHGGNLVVGTGIGIAFELNVKSISKNLTQSLGLVKRHLNTQFARP